MKIAYFWLTQEGHALAQRLQTTFGGCVEPKESFVQVVAQDFSSYDALVFVMACGIVVRTIAPLLQSKAMDPAVLVLDQQGQYVISLLSGHLGGANVLAKRVAAAIGAKPVITTATDVKGLIAFDEFAKRNHLVIENLSAIKQISGALLAGKQVALCTELPLAEDFSIPQVEIAAKSDLPYQVLVTDRLVPMVEDRKTLLLRPRDLVIGIGCKRQIAPAHLAQCLLAFLQTYALSPFSIASFATIGLKQQETAILQLCQTYDCSLEIVADETIQACTYPFETSEFVRQVTGLPSVAQACSYLASGCGTVLTGKVKYEGVTLAACRKKMPPLIP